MISFCFDQVPWPNLAQPGVTDLDNTWPRVNALRLLKYLALNQMEFCMESTDRATAGSWYPISVGWFDHTLDYFSLMPADSLAHVRSGHIRVLFYYHEGDNPQRIVQRIHDLAHEHDIDCNNICLISANTQADHIPGAVYFADHEQFFHSLNRHQPAPPFENFQPKKHFVALNRTNKSWRAACVSDLLNLGLIDPGYFSYDAYLSVDDDECPLELDRIHGWRSRIDRFLAGAPYRCDTLDQDQQNDHSWVNIELYRKSACHIVLETFYEADASQGTFLSEKTWKCIKFGQPFVIVGPAGSLAHLRQLGYKVFDNAIDNSYDQIQHSTERWLAIRRALKYIHNQPKPETWLEHCKEDILHNQNWFQHRQKKALQDLMERLQSC